MKDSRYKEIMKDLGMPNSRSLLIALQQVANEVEQEVRLGYEKNNKKLQMDACGINKTICNSNVENICQIHSQPCSSTTEL